MGTENLSPVFFYQTRFSSGWTRRFWTRNPEILKSEPGRPGRVLNGLGWPIPETRFFIVNNNYITYFYK